MTDLTNTDLLDPAREVLADFPIDAAEVILFAKAENLTYRVTATSGERFTLRLHRMGYHTLEELESERLWTKALLLDGIHVPIPVATRGGAEYASVELPALGERRYASLSHWVEGEVLLPMICDETPTARMQSIFRDLGAMIAAMHNQASAWQPPAGFVRQALDEVGLLGDQPFWGRFWERSDLTPDERDLLIEVRDQLRVLLSGYGKDSTQYSVIHADLHPGNVLIEGETLAAIDFDDVAFGWHMFDLAVALHQCQHLADYDAVQAACIEGYVSARSVTDHNLAMIPIFLLVRGMSEIGWFADRPENATPEEYKAMKDFVIVQCQDYIASRPLTNGSSARA